MSETVMEIKSKDGKSQLYFISQDALEKQRLWTSYRETLMRVSSFGRIKKNGLMKTYLLETFPQFKEFIDKDFENEL